MRIEIYDITGRLVRTVFRGERAAGTYDAAWDGGDASGARAPEGIYLARGSRRKDAGSRSD